MTVHRPRAACARPAAARPYGLAPGDVREFDRLPIPTGVRFLPDGRTIAVEARCIELLDAHTGDRLGRVWRSDPPPPPLAPLLPVGRMVLAGTPSGLCDVVDFVGGDARDFTIPAAALDYLIAEPAGLCDRASAYSAATGIALSPDGGQALVAYGQAFALLWDVRTRRLLRMIGDDRPYTSPPRIFRVAWAPSGTTVLTRDDTHRIRLWDAIDGARVGELRLWRRWAADPDGGAVAGASVWDLGGIGPVCFLDPAGVILAADGNVVRVLDSRTGRELDVWRGHGTEHPILQGPRGCPDILDIRVSADRRRVLTVGNDATLRVWDVAAGEEIWCVTPDPCCGDWADISPDGRHVVWCGCPGVRLYAI